MYVGKRGIRIDTVMPGVIDTPMVRSGQEVSDIRPPAVPMIRFGASDEIAYMTVWLLSDEST